MEIKKINNDYFEGILQLRNPSKELIRFVESITKKDKKALITKRVSVTNGLDLYFTSQRYLRSLGNKIKGNFPGELKTSRKIFTRKRQTSRDVFRVNVLFRMSNLRKGQAINYKGEQIRIMNIGKKVFARSISTGKKLTLNYGDLADSN